MPRTLATLVILSALTAGAADAAPANYERGYDLTLGKAAIDLHIGLAVATPQGTAAWGDKLTVWLDPDGIDAAEEADLAFDLTDACADAGLPEAACAPLVTNIVGSVVTFNDALIGAVPVFAEFDVGSWGWASVLFKLYPMFGSHETLDGTVSAWNYILNDNNGAFLAGGLALNGGGVQGSLACADVSGALVSGGFWSAGALLDADFVADRELMCLGAVDGLVVAGTVGLAFAGAVDGIGQ